MGRFNLGTKGDLTLVIVRSLTLTQTQADLNAHDQSGKNKMTTKNSLIIDYIDTSAIFTHGSGRILSILWHPAVL